MSLQVMIEWPKDGSTVCFEDLTAHLVLAVQHCYKLERQNRDLDVPYKGYRIGNKERATCLSPDHQLSAEQLRYSEEEQGRDALTEILGLAVRLGIEQGRRLAKEEDPLYQLYVNNLKKLYRDRRGEESNEPTDP